MCSVSSLYGDQAITGLLESCKGWGKVLWEIQNLKIQMFMDHTLTDYRGKLHGLIKALTTVSFALFTVHICIWVFVFFVSRFLLVCSYFGYRVEWVFACVAEVEKFFQQCDPGKLFLLE